jgi:cytochrome c oxidase subunit I+III
LERLQRAWAVPSGLISFFTAVNHRSIGLRYIVTAFLFFLAAGIQALVMRVQLAQPGLSVLSPEAFNQFMTMHGSTMMFLFAVPMMEGLGIYVVPLMIGARDMAYPRLNAFGYWVYLISGLTLYTGFLAGRGPDGGWFNYVPLTGPGFSPGVGIDFWVTTITFVEVAALVAAVELIVTIFKMRAPGMSVNRIPIFVWSILVMAFMIVFAMPVLMVASVLLGLDRLVGTHFFNAAAGGQPVLWQHLFWVFGHPEVYIIALPGFGIVSTVIPTFVRRPIAGYTLVVMSIVAIGFLSFGLWVHHMFASGLPLLGMNFFAAASMMIAIPSGIQVFSWIATIWRGRAIVNTPFLFSIGFIIIFVIGGLTGVMVASVPFDLQVHDTYFLVAHFHYVLIGATVFPLFAAIYYWFPKMTGHPLSERLGKWNFWLMFIGFNITFFPMHITGLIGMPRRVYTFLPGFGWDGLNLLSTIGSFILALGIFVVLVNVVLSLLFGDDAADNPWQAGTLEWATTSPPPQYNFPVLPVVRGRNPLWEQDHLRPTVPTTARGWEEFVDAPELRRESLATTILDASPDYRIRLPGPTSWPFWLAVAVAITFIGSMVHLLFVPLGGLLAYLAIVGWNWPRDEPEDEEKKHAEEAEGAAESGQKLPHLVSGSRSTGWWGIFLLIVIEITVFASLIVSYFYLKTRAEAWPLGGIDPPDLLLPSINALILLASAAPMWWSVRGILQGDQRRLLIGLLISMALGATFLGLKVLEYSDVPYTWATNAYGSAIWTITGFHTVHVIGMLLKSGAIGIAAWKGHFSARLHVAVQGNALYWYFVVAIWIPLFATLYLSPRFL